MTLMECDLWGLSEIKIVLRPRDCVLPLTALIRVE